MKMFTVECPECGDKQKVAEDLLSLRRSIGCQVCKKFFVVEGLRSHGFIYCDEDDAEKVGKS